METKKSNKANLESKRFLFFQIGLIVTLGVVLAAFEYSERFQTEKDDWDNRIVAMSFDEEMPPITIREKKANVKPRKPRVLTRFEIVKELFEELPDEPLDLNINSTSDPEIFTDMPEEAPDVDGIQDFFRVEKKPEFPGGMKALYKFISKHIKYPYACADMGIEGTVHIRFIIDKKGRVTEISLVRGADRHLDKEAMRVIAMMPNWSPGKQRDVPVNVSFQMPVRFNLASN